MNKIISSILIVFAILLSGCGGTVLNKTDLTADDEGRARDYTLASGLNVVEFDELECNNTLKLCGPKGFRMIGGKEQGNISIKIYNADGKLVFEYIASDVKAFQGQKFRTDAEKFLAKQGITATTKVLTGLVDLARQANGLP